MYRLAEKTTGSYAEVMIEQTGLPSSRLDKLIVLDNACGTGVVGTKLLEGNSLSQASRAKLNLTCADFAEAMVDATKEKAAARGWSNVSTVRADAMDTKLPSAHFSHILFNFGPFLLREPMKGLSECKRMLQPGGVLGISTWEHVPWYDEFKPIFQERPDLPPYPDSEKYMLTLLRDTPERWDNVADVRDNLLNAGFVDVNAQRIVRKTEFTIDEVMTTTPGTIGVLSSKLWTEEQRKTMTEPTTKAIEEYLRKKYGDKPLTWEWVAVVATGRKPE